MKLNFVGKSVTRTDVVNKVTGSLKYVLDQEMQGMLYGKFLRSECARAKIININVSSAKEISGVFDVITANDLPQPVPRFGSFKDDQPLLADREILYHGEPIAIVLAISEEIANKALSYIKVEYEELPSICTIDDALKPDAPLVNDECVKNNSNIGGEWNYHWGDVEAVKSNSYLSIKNEYYFPMVHHLPIEPYSCISYPEGEGVVIKSPIQHPFILRLAVAKALKLKFSQVRVIANSIGGGFGGKGYPKIEPLAAYLALRTGRPIKITLSMSEGFFSARRVSAKVKIQTGFKRDGSIEYQEISSNCLMGAYADCALKIASKASYTSCGAYRTPNAQIYCNAIYSNTVPGTAFRGFGLPQLMWALESQMNEASRELKINPLEIRLRNLPAKGETLIPGDSPVDGEWAEGLRKAAEAISWGYPKERNIGRGIAIGIKSPIPAAVSQAIVKLHHDSSVTVSIGTTEMGQGAITVMGQIVAELLDLPMNHISIVMGDTAVSPYDTSTASSRSTVSMGNAVISACQDIKKQLKDAMYSLYTQEPKNEVIVANGFVTGYGRKISYSDLIKEYYWPSLGELVGQGIYQGKQKDINHPLGGLADFWEIVFTGVEARIDPEVGKIYIKKLVNVSDIGKVINPLQAEVQEQGAAIMGIGSAVMEQMIYDSSSSKLLNGSVLDYRIPTSMDIPQEFKGIFIENQDGPGPFGSKGMGESGIMAVAPAIAGAVFDAVGITLRELPLTPERIWQELNTTRKKA